MKRHLSARTRDAFRRKVYDYFRANRREFSWRKTRDPYYILVSEIMLQQTQTDRVEKKFKEFIAAFPTVESLARARLKDVLAVWHGMGYNRRGLYLKQAAEEIVRRHNGTVPRNAEALDALPGIGAATALAILAYAFNEPVCFIETNIRAVYIHEFFKGRDNVPDNELLPLVEATCDRANAREWYNALMDYGTMLKERYKNPARRSAHYARQSPYLTSDRRVRGLLLKHLSGAGGMLSSRAIAALKLCEPGRLERCLAGLVKDGLLEKKGNSYRIP